MIVKLIRCEVRPYQRASFSNSQSKWGRIASAPGFICQIGGWSQTSENMAMIFSVWEDVASIDYFMRHIHDAIINKTKQNLDYERCDVSFFTAPIESPTTFGKAFKVVMKPGTKASAKLKVTLRMLESVEPNSNSKSKSIVLQAKDAFPNWRELSGSFETVPEWQVLARTR